MAVKKPSHRTLGLAAIITGTVSLSLLVIPYMLFPQFYVSKTNPAMGYTSPATIEGWTFMAIGLALLAVTIILAKLYKNY